MSEKLSKYGKMVLLTLSAYNEHEIQCMKIPRDEILNFDIIDDNGKIALDIEMKYSKTTLYDTNLLYEWQNMVGIDVVFYNLQTAGIYNLQGKFGYNCKLEENFIKN